MQKLVKEGTNECISNEIEVLSNLESHQNIVRLIGQNMDEKLIILGRQTLSMTMEYMSKK